MKKYRVNIDISCNSKAEAIDIERMINEWNTETGYRLIDVRVVDVTYLDGTTDYGVTVRSDSDTKKELIKYLGLKKKSKGVSSYVMRA